MKKRILTLALALALALTLAACGGNSDNGGGSTTTPPANGDTPAQTGNDGSQTTEQPANNGGGEEWPDNAFTQQVPKPDDSVIGQHRGYTKDFDQVDVSDADSIVFGMKWDSMDDAKAYAAEVKTAGFSEEKKTEETVGPPGPSTYDWIATNGTYYVEVHFYVSGDGEMKQSDLTIANYDISEE
jgi:predicted small secreted protein